MNDQKFTRCPGCSTVFRVTQAQLALREGQVRCGHCRAVFDANDHLVSLDTAPVPDQFDDTDELIMGRPTVTLRSADALQRVDAPAVRDAFRDAPAPDATEVRGSGQSSVDEEPREAFPSPPSVAEEPDVHAGAYQAAGDNAPDTAADSLPAAGNAHVAEDRDVDAGAYEVASDNAPDTAAELPPAAGEAPAGDSATDAGASLVAEEPARTLLATGSVPSPVALDSAAVGPARRFEWKQRSGQHGPRRRVYAIAAAALVVGLALQTVLEFHDALAAHVPSTRPILESACGVLGCSIEPLRDVTALSIDASDLQADPAHRGLLLLSATLRNRTAHAVAFPYLELTLTDASDQVVARRAFAPAEYAGGTADPHQGISPNGERIVRIFLDASATQQAGYRLYFFYP